MRVTHDFRRKVLEDPNRSEITAQMCERIVAEARYARRQRDGRWQVWGYVRELGYYVRVITDADRQELHNAFKDRNFTRQREREIEKPMKIYYSPETDSLSIKLREGGEEVEGHIAGEDLNDRVVVHRDDAGKLYEIEILWGAREAVDLGRLEVEGLPISVSSGARRESKAG